ncbi:ATP-binding cassette sub-family C member 10-like isoform X2 [Clytia hemisphaerica]|uniref:ABC-type xenobiotic transporter n=1 Tax=Clytia hemisphaerica TaxID=252671 RepID=A0A7M5UK99_9CNID
MENIQRFCGLSSNETFHAWDNKNKIFTNCFQWTVSSLVSHSLLLICCAYLFGISKVSYRKTNRKETWLSETLCILLSLSNIVEVILSYALKQHHPPAYVLARTLSTATWMLCLAIHVRTRSTLRQRKINSKYVFFFSVLILVSNCFSLHSVIKLIERSGNLHFENWPVLYYGVFTNFFLEFCFTITCIALLSTKLKKTSFNRGLPSLSGNVSIQADSSTLVESGASSQGSYYEEYIKLKEEQKDIFLGKAESGSNIFSKALFLWSNRLILKGYYEQLNSPEDLYTLPSSIDTGSIKERFSNMIRIQKNSSIFEEFDNKSITEYNHERKKKKHFKLSLIKSLNSAYGRRFWCLGILKFIIDVLDFAGPLLLNFLLSFMENKTEPISHGYYYALALFLSTFLSTILAGHYQYQIRIVNLQIRASLITSIYEKTLSISTSTLNGFSTGQVVNYMSTDTNRISGFTYSFHEFWSLPFKVAVCLYLLYKQVGISFLAGVGVIVLLIPINKWISSKILKLSEKVMKQKDERVKIISEILHGIRIIKLYAWEKHFKDKVNSARNKELESLKGRKYLDAFCVFFWATSTTWISILTFSLYVLLGHELTAAKVFTSIALFNILIGPINSFAWVINGLLESWVSLKRVQKFLSTPEINLDEYFIKTTNDDGDATVFELDGATFSWKDEEGYVNIELNNAGGGGEKGGEGGEEENDFVVATPFSLKNISMFVEKGQLVGITGKVGSGKSSFFAALTAEMEKNSGYIYLGEEFKGFAFVTQEPWIQHMTIRDNILFGSPYDEEKYQEVLHACALREDLSQFPAADFTEVGENGVNLSGGQKARLSLARAVYQDKDVYLLDDPLSAVDAHVAAHLFEHCIMGLLKDKTRLLSTHHKKFLWSADSVILFEDGEILSRGPPEEVLDRKESSGKEKDAPTQQESHSTTDEDKEKRETDKLVEEEEKERGAVNLHVYASYWKAAGSLVSPAIVLFVCLMTASRYLADWWLAFWISEEKQYDETTVYSLYRTEYTFGNSSKPHHHDVKYYLSVYATIAGTNSVLALIRAFLFAYGGVKAAKYFHTHLLDTILKAPVIFFDTNPIGRIINRFSSDTWSIDDSLPFIVNIVFAQASAVLGTLIITCYGIPWFSAALIPLVGIYYYTQRYYRPTSREVKRLTSVTQSPVYEHFSETLSGLMTIRAFKDTVRFISENERKLDFNQRAMYSGVVAQIWLQLRLNFIGVVMVTAVAILAVLEHHYSSVNPGLVGLAISYALSITGLLNGLINFFTESEKQFVSVERVLNYIEKTPAEDESNNNMNDEFWPPHGAVCFRNVCLQYRENLPFALEEVSFFVKAGEKVGICGRTGSGKSSLFRLLFKILDVTRGEIIIDGMNLSHISISQTRSKMAIIPQDPFLFDDTILQNLDPQGKYAAFEIDDVIQKCHLTKLVNNLGGLEGKVGERGCNLSAGQKQLMCLARALLKKSKIICIDEATASVDMETDQQIQEALRNEFVASTVLTIAHRIETIMDCDRVLVMDNGHVAEFAPPKDLLQDHESMFYSLVSETIEQQTH